MLLDSAKDLLWEPKRLRHCSYIVTTIIIHSAIQLHFPAIFHILFVYFTKKESSMYSLFPPTHALLSPYSHILSLFIDLLDSFLLGFELWTFSALRIIVKVAATFTWVFGGYGLKTFKDFPRSKGQISHPLQLCGVSWGSTASTGSTGSWGRTTTSVIS